VDGREEVTVNRVEPSGPDERLRFLETSGPDACKVPDKAKTLVIIPFGPVEFHGAHLPRSTDLVLAESFARAGAKQFLSTHPEWHALIYPVIPLGADCVPHPGSVSVSYRLVAHAAMDVGGHFIRHGFSNIVFMSGHGGFNHDRALERAARRLNRRYGKRDVRVVAPLGSAMFKLWASGIREKLTPLVGHELDLKEEDFLYEVHGGCWETSMVLAHYPERVSGAYRSTPDYRPPTKVWVRWLLSVLQKILPIKYGERIGETKTLMQVGMSWFWGDTSAGYLGFPSKASPDVGEASTKLAGQVFADVFHRLFVEKADLGEAESVYSLLDLLRWYGLGAGLVLLIVLALLILW